MAKRKTNIHGREGIAGWIFTAPAMIILGVFLFVPILMALWVSMTNWTGNVDPFGGGPNAAFVGTKNYTALFMQEGLARSNFMQSLGNTFYYVLLVVPLQTATSLLLALIVNEKFLRGKSFFRTAFYFPSVTSSIAISTVFLFLFSNTGAVNGFLKVLGIDGPQWFSDSGGSVGQPAAMAAVPFFWRSASMDFASAPLPRVASLELNAAMTGSNPGRLTGPWP